MTARENRRDHWSRKVAEQIASNRSVTAFCQEQMLNEKTFRRWKRELTRPEAARPVSWCPVPPAAAEQEKGMGKGIQMKVFLDQLRQSVDLLAHVRVTTAR
jgi:hypothetical protein